MNEMYVLTALMIYTLVLLVDALIDGYYRYLAKRSPETLIEEVAVPSINEYISRLRNFELPKEYRLNMKRRPPIIFGAH